MSNLKPLTVLATSVGNDGFPSVFKALKENGERDVKIVGVDVRRSAAGLYLSDASALVSTRDVEDGQAVLRELLALIEQHDVDVLLPLSTQDQSFFATHRDVFAAVGVPVIVGTLDSIETSNNKLALLEASSTAGIPCPDYVAVDSVEEVEAALPRLGWPERPFVFKTNLGTGAQGVKIVEPNRPAFERLLDRDNMRIPLRDLLEGLSAADLFPPSHLAEFLVGEEYSVDVLCHDGVSLSVVVRDRLATLYGLATHSVVIDDPEIHEAAVRVVKLMSLSYVVNVQFRRDAAGTARLMEVNPRIPGTIGLSVEAGVNMPYLAIKLALGEEFDAPQPRIGTELVRTWQTLTIDA